MSWLPWSFGGAVHAEVGRRQSQVERMTDPAAERALIMERLVARNEDAGMAEVASTLTQPQSTLQASYTVFSWLSSLSLVNFLR